MQVRPFCRQFDVAAVSTQHVHVRVSVTKLSNWPFNYCVQVTSVNVTFFMGVNVTLIS